MPPIYGSIYDDNNTIGPDGIFHESLKGTSDNDYIFADDGNDLVLAGAGNDTIDGGNGVDALYAGADNDLLYGWNGDDLLVGDSGNDTLYGENDNDLLYGKTGNDSLDGGAGRDSLNGYGEGTEFDTLTGGADADEFVLGQQTLFSSNGYSYYLGEGHATITDFNYQQDDKFQVFGSINDYSLGTSNWSGSDALDTGIYYQGDLIAVVQDKSGDDVLLAYDFNFVV
jgi:Ca2+-binding RTX toxin-like protein